MSQYFTKLDESKIKYQKFQNRGYELCYEHAKKTIKFNKEISNNNIIYPKVFKKEMKTFYDNTD